MDSGGPIVIEHELTIGRVDGDADYAFGWIDRIVPRDDGGFFTCDRQDPRIRSYDSLGTFVGMIGRRGRGPGEYLTCERFFLLDGVVHVSDVLQRRIVQFDLGSGRSRVVAMPTGGALAAIRGDGTMFVQESRQGRTADERGWEKLLLVSRRGDLLDSLEIPSRRRPVGADNLVTSTENGDLNPRLEDTIVAIAPVGAVLVARADEYKIELRNASFTRVITRAVPALEYARAERAEWDRILREHPNQPLVPLPDRKPRVRELRVDELERAWVKVAVKSYQRTPPPDPPSARPNRPRLSYVEQGTWDLFDLRQGDYIGRVELPRGHFLVASRGDKLWLTSSGSDGEQLLSVYRMRRGAADVP